jgi:putative transposase
VIAFTGFSSQALLPCGKKHTAEQVVNLLPQVEVGVANGKSMSQAGKQAEIVEQTHYR